MHLRWVPPALVLVATLAGCGKSEAPGVASAGSGASGKPAATSDAVAAYVESTRKFVACMREAGFDLPDPDAKGNIDLSGVGRRKGEPAFIAASKKCQPLLLPSPEELNMLPPKTATEIARTREYAKCMRENGVPSFADPGPDGHWTRDSENQTISEEESAAMFRAGQICEPVLDGRPRTTPNPNYSGQG